MPSCISKSLKIYFSSKINCYIYSRSQKHVYFLPKSITKHRYNSIWLGVMPIMCKCYIGCDIISAVFVVGFGGFFFFIKGSIGKINCLDRASYGSAGWWYHKKSLIKSETSLMSSFMKNLDSDGPATWWGMSVTRGLFELSRTQMSLTYLYQQNDSWPRVILFREDLECSRIQTLAWILAGPIIDGPVTS